MNVDDVVCVGAEPLVFVDCIAIERLDPDEAAEIVAGVADGCVEAGCELVGGETAQLPGLLAPGAYEVMGTCVGVVDEDRAWGPHRVRDGRRRRRARVERPALATGSRSCAACSRRPTRRRRPGCSRRRRSTRASCSRWRDEVDVHAAAHVTGGGIADNLARVVPDGLGADVDLSTWQRPRRVRLDRRARRDLRGRDARDVQPRRRDARS